MKTAPKILASQLGEFVASGVVLFSIAGTFNYWQAWIFLAVFVLATWIPTVIVLRTNPAVLERRTRGGPTTETRVVQKVVIAGLYLSLMTLLVVSALDYRLGWSREPTAICLVGDVLVAVGLGVVMLVVIQNRYAAVTVRVEEGQTVASTGLYGMVRHPMYTGNLITMAGIPLALGSYCGLVFVLSGLIVLVLRIRDEETLLHEELTGYREYTQTVRYRLVPGIW